MTKNVLQNSNRLRKKASYNYTCESSSGVTESLSFITCYISTSWNQPRPVTLQFVCVKTETKWTTELVCRKRCLAVVEASKEPSAILRVGVVTWNKILRNQFMSLVHKNHDPRNAYIIHTNTFRIQLKVNYDNKQILRLLTLMFRANESCFRYRRYLRGSWTSLSVRYTSGPYTYLVASVESQSRRTVELEYLCVESFCLIFSH